MMCMENYICDFSTVPLVGTSVVLHQIIFFFQNFLVNLTWDDNDQFLLI